MTINNIYDLKMDIDNVESEDADQSHAPIGINVTIHPIVIMSVSDQFMRIKSEDSSLKVVGALMGTYKSPEIEILKIVELLYENDCINEEYLNQRLDQVKTVEPDLEFIGFYSIGQSYDQIDKQMFEIQAKSECILLLKFDVDKVAGHEHLPIKIYEATIDSSGHCAFKSINFSLHSEEAEAIGIKHISVNKMTINKNFSASMIQDHLQPQQQAIVMLHNRIEYLVKYLEAVENKELPIDYAIIRELNTIVSALPMQNNSEFQNQIQKDTKEICLTSLLSAMAQSIYVLQSLLTKQTLIERDVMKKMSTMRWDNIYN